MNIRQMLMMGLCLCGAVFAADSQGDAAKMLQAAELGSVEQVRELLEAGVSPDVRDEDEWTPLIHAVRAGAEEMTRLLLAAGAKVNYACSEGDTALFHALWLPSPACVQMLLAAGADVNARVMGEFSPLDVVEADITEEKDAERLRRMEECARLLREAGAQRSANDECLNGEEDEESDASLSLTEAQVAERVACLRECIQAMSEMLSVSAGITDKDSADAAAPRVRELSTKVNRLLSLHLYLSDYPEIKACKDEIEQLWRQAEQESARLSQAHLYGSVKLAEASGYSPAIVRDHQTRTPELKQRIAAAFMARYAELSAELPTITGGPGTGEENAWLLADSETSTQAALVEHLLGGVLEEVMSMGYMRKITPEHYFIVLRLSGKFEDKYYMLPVWIDLNAQLQTDSLQRLPDSGNMTP